MASKARNVPQRRDDLIVQKVGDEVIVYDQASHRAHSLNRTAALVFEKLDGKTGLTGVARHVGKALRRSPQQGLVDAAVNELAEADLLRPGAELPRRSVLRGLAVGLLPAVLSIAVPPAAAAASCKITGDACTYGVDVCCDACDTCTNFGSGPFSCQPTC